MDSVSLNADKTYLDMSKLSGKTQQRNCHNIQTIFHKLCLISFPSLHVSIIISNYAKASIQINDVVHILSAYTVASTEAEKDL